VGLGTAIHNIVGGSGGPIASADRVNFLRFTNRHFWGGERMLRIGIAAGRFPYQNAPFGVVPRSAQEAALWPCLRRTLFLEALEIFLRLLRGEVLSSAQVCTYPTSEQEARETLKEHFPALQAQIEFPFAAPRWQFEALQLVPRPEADDRLRIVLGSQDPQAIEVAQRYGDPDLFNLSFTPPAQIEALHRKLSALNQARGRTWERARLPRTVLVFIDRDRRKARELADFVLDAYLDALRGTAQVPDKSILLDRALVGDAAEIREQMQPGAPRGLHPSDRLMLWFEFNQLDTTSIESRMRYFFAEVAAKL
jgi:alkanesulfonate monooxygenase SsuD/methylene tetrahydromethanopterin reductase-like flavin-dependent oxidoreductase (luciferase family)